MVISTSSSPQVKYRYPKPVPLKVVGYPSSVFRYVSYLMPALNLPLCTLTLANPLKPNNWSGRAALMSVSSW